MGFAIANQLYHLGANVTLVSGPTHEICEAGINRIDVMSAEDMHQACLAHFSKSVVTIMSAAVADYTPLNVAIQKIKKSDDELSIALKRTVDILADLGSKKQAGQLLVGFALETDNEEQNAISKLQRKNLDLIVLNSLNDHGAGFQGDTNKITIFNQELQKKSFDVKSKTEVAKDICQEILALL